LTASPEDPGEAEAVIDNKPKKTARRQPKKPTVSSPTLDDFDRDDMVAAIREVFSHTLVLDRDAAIREVARALGFGRTGPRIAQAIDSALIAAAKRGVVFNDRGALTLWSRNISAYSRDELISTLLSVMGVVWWEREEAIRAAARHLGFRRAGSLIRDAFKSAINGALRRGLIERDGQQIRRAK
jgi:hypothetical protein